MKDENPNSRNGIPSGPAHVGRRAGDTPVADSAVAGLGGAPGHGVLGYGMPGVGVPDHPVLDRSGAMRRLELDAESYGQLLALMTVEVAGMLDALTEAWRNGDASAMRLHAHRLKSEAANVGAEEVRFAASRLEQLLRQQDAADGDVPRTAASGDASAAVSHLRTALARLAAVLGP